MIGHDGSLVGIMSAQDALVRAKEAELDLVEIAADAKPPVVKIIDFGKYMYDLNKRDREQRRKQKEKMTKLKEMQLGPKISKHDFEFKLKHVREFLEEADKVKIVMQLRGREIQHADIAVDVMRRFAKGLMDLAIIEKEPTRESARRITMMVAPKKEDKPKAGGTPAEAGGEKRRVITSPAASKA